MSKKEDVTGRSSSRTGLAWILETFLRRFRTLAFLIFLAPLVIVCCVSLGVSLAPGIFLFEKALFWTADWSPVTRALVLGITIVFGYLGYGITLIFVLPLVNFLIPFKVKPFRGGWYSLPAIPWYIHNALTYMARFTFLEFVTPSPLNVLFYRMMGMKIGKGVVINTTNISDPCLITLDDYVTLGGSVTIFAHYGQKGYLIVSTVHIKKGATIGLKASVMGDVIVGEKAMIRPHVVLSPKTRVPDESTI